MELTISGKKIHCRLVCDTGRQFPFVLLRNMRNMTGDLAGEDCYEPRLKGNRDPLFVYRVDFRTWLLSEVGLTETEIMDAVVQSGQRPKHLDSRIQQDAERYEEDRED